MGWSAADDEQRIGRIHGRYDGLLEAIRVVAEVSGPLKLEDFSEAAWKMLCEVQARLAGLAAKAAEDMANNR